MENIPQWIVDYDKKNYQSSAGKAIRILLERNKELEGRIILLYSETFADGLPSEMDEGEVIRKHLEQSFPEINFNP